MAKRGETVRSDGTYYARRADVRRERVVLMVLAAALVIAVAASLAIGRYGVPVHELVSLAGDYLNGSVTQETQSAASVLLLVRIPRILLAVMAGAALAASGAAYQGLFKNPMVSPDILGVTGGASFGAAFALLIGLPSIGVQALAFGVGVAAVCVVMAFARLVGNGGGKLLFMVLCGTVVSSVFSSLTSLVKYLADADDKLPDIVFWLMGSFARSGSYVNDLAMLVCLIIGSVPLLMLRWQLNALAFGEEEALTLGVNAAKVRFVVVACATLLTATTVCFCGVVGWVGLILPHAARLVVGPNYRALLPVSMLGGAVFMLVVDNVARTAVSGEIPVGILTSIIGAPLFIYLLIKGRRGWS